MGEAQAGRPALQAGQQEDLERRAEAAHRVPAERLRRHELACVAQRPAGDRDAAVRRQAFEPVGDVHHDAGDVEVGGEIRGHGARQHLAGVDADPDRQAGVAELPDRRLHRQRRAAGAHRMVLLWLGRPEQRHDPVALHPHHRAFEAADRFLHGLDRRSEAPIGVFRAQFRDRAGRARDVGEQDGDLLELALRGDRHGWRRAACRRERGAALVAEARGRRVVLAAGRTAARQRFAATAAKAMVGCVFRVTACAAHGVPEGKLRARRDDLAEPRSIARVRPACHDEWTTMPSNSPSCEERRWRRLTSGAPAQRGHRRDSQSAARPGNPGQTCGGRSLTCPTPSRLDCRTLCLRLTVRSRSATNCTMPCSRYLYHPNSCGRRRTADAGSRQPRSWRDSARPSPISP